MKQNNRIKFYFYPTPGSDINGYKAQFKPSKNQPDIILLDINLKGKIDGIETALSLQSKNIPIIFLTANSDDATFNRARQARPVAFISKPFKQPDLQRAIELTISPERKKSWRKTVQDLLYVEPSATIAGAALD